MHGMDRMNVTERFRFILNVLASLFPFSARFSITMHKMTIIGGGLAGCEAAWQAARLGVPVVLYEMRPQHFSPAHMTEGLAELVCSNSLRGESLENAVGLLKEE